MGLDSARHIDQEAVMPRTVRRTEHLFGGDQKHNALQIEVEHDDGCWSVLTEITPDALVEEKYRRPLRVRLVFLEMESSQQEAE